MGGLQGLMSMLPGAGNMKQMAAAGMHEKKIAHQIAIIDSMTPTGRAIPNLIKANRKSDRRVRYHHPAGQQLLKQ